LLGQGGDTINGNGNDTLQIGRDSIDDSTFKTVQGINVLSLTGASSVEIGSYADNSGLVTISGDNAPATIVQDAIATGAYYFDGSNDLSTVGGNWFEVANIAQLATGKDTIMAGNGTDTLAIDAGASIADATFANVNGVSVLALTGSNSVTLGANAGNIANFTTVVGGTGSSTFNHLASDFNNISLDGSAGTANLFVEANSGMLGSGNDTITGSGNDTLSLGQDSYSDSIFNSVKGINVLSLAGSSDVTLGANAMNAGISDIIGGTGASSIDASATSSNLILDGSNATGANLLIAGSGSDTLIAGVGADTLTAGSGADLFVLNNTTGTADGSNVPTILGFNTALDSIQLPNTGGLSGVTYGLTDSSNVDNSGNEIWNLTNNSTGNILAQVGVIGSYNPNSNLHLI
jgi:Ca2+-binding RTX toxin-like protein